MTLLSRRQLPLVLGSIAIAAAGAGCKTSGIKDAYTAKDAEGRRKQKVFFVSKNEIHVIIELVSGVEDVLLQVDIVPPEDAPVDFEEKELSPGKGSFKINLQLFLMPAAGTEGGQKSEVGPWPEGDYEVGIYLEGSHERSLFFSVIPDPEEE